MEGKKRWQHYCGDSSSHKEPGRGAEEAHTDLPPGLSHQVDKNQEAGSLTACGPDSGCACKQQAGRWHCKAPSATRDREGRQLVLGKGQFNRIYVFQKVDKNFTRHSRQTSTSEKKKKKWCTRYWIYSPTSNKSNADQNLRISSAALESDPGESEDEPKNWGGETRQRLSMLEWGGAGGQGSQGRVWERKGPHTGCPGDLRRDHRSESPAEN